MGNLISTKSNNYRFLILGIDYCGKKKILYRIKYNQNVPTIPSKGLFSEETQYRLDNGEVYNINLLVICGQNKIRPLWPGTYRNNNSSALIFVIDSNDRDRIYEVKDEIHLLNNVLENQDPFLFLANKSDLKNSMKSYELISILELNKLDFKRKWTILDTNALIDIKLGGIDNGLKWLFYALSTSTLN